MRKRITALTLALVLAFSLVPTAFAADLAKASTQSVEVDGTKIEFQMYALADANGGLTNYVKLRDVAHVLNSTPAKFSVGYDGMISITTGESYTDNGSEMSTPYSGDRAYQPGPGSVKVNGADVNLDAIVLTDDNGGAYTYFKLRDLGTALGFTVDWTGERGVFIETDKPPVPAAPSVPTALEALQGAWLSPVLTSDKDGRFTEEMIITGNEVKMLQQYPDTGKLNWHMGTINVKTDAAANGSGFPCVLEITMTKTATKDTPDLRDRKKPQTVTRKFSGFDPDTNLPIIDGHFYRKVELSDPDTPNAAVQVLEAGVKAELEKLGNYPTYAEYPLVPDFGAIYGLSYIGDPSLFGQMHSYKYSANQASDIALERGLCQRYPDYDPDTGYIPSYRTERYHGEEYETLIEDYIRILEECGFEQEEYDLMWAERTTRTGYTGHGYTVSFGYIDDLHLSIPEGLTSMGKFAVYVQEG